MLFYKILQLFKFILLRVLLTVVLIGVVMLLVLLLNFFGIKTQ